MGSEWAVLSLEDCVDTLIDYRGKTPRKTAYGIPLITAKIVKGGTIGTPDEFIAVDDYEAWMRRGIPKAGDVVLTTEAPLGEVAQLGSERVALAQRLIAIRGKPGVLDNNFLKYLMQSKDVQEQLRARASGTTVFGIKQSELRKILLTLPPLAEQRAIAAVLGALDDKIELNRRMNGTLEATARALFKAWFVDFEPVRARMEGRPSGLPGEIEALFPEEWEEGEGGVRPRGWGVEQLGDLIELAYGKALKEGDRQPGEVAVFGSNGQIGWHHEKLVEGPGIIVGRKGNPGTVIWSHVDFFPIDTAFYVVPKRASMNLYFLLYALQEQGLPSLSADSAVPGLNRNLAYMNAQLVPSVGVLQQFDHIVRPVFQRIHSNNNESRTLAALRDELLPRLMRGEVRVAVEEKGL